ncbi:restriction endonuclease subunit S [Oceaniglobus trochenteri]|uniref:restriction endonuclease subunit S n=1 Tax=Oceaniglobus trochenteri TaxID=2763260 RepID=UPI001CFFA1CD|nr:restriction endonuclease subunit S [Oceaniglobus trochenteri]
MTSSWTEKSLGEIMTLQRGFDLPKKERREGQIPIISSSGAEDFHAVPAKHGPGVVTGRYGTIGKVYYSEGPYWPLNTTLFVSNFQGNNEKYCYYLLSRLDFHEHSGKTGVPGVNRNDLHTVPMWAITDPGEQEAIAEALSDADALIEGLERLIAKKRLIKQGAMQDLLTAKRRLPGFSGEWNETTFGQCFQFLRTGSASRSQLGTNLGVGYIHYGDIHGMKSVLLDLSRSRLPEITPGQVATLPRVKDGDLVIADASEDVMDVGKSIEVRGVGRADVVAGLHTFLLRGNVPSYGPIKAISRCRATLSFG